MNIDINHLNKLIAEGKKYAPGGSIGNILNEMADIINETEPSEPTPEVVHIGMRSPWGIIEDLFYSERLGCWIAVSDDVAQRSDGDWSPEGLNDNGGTLRVWPPVPNADPETQEPAQEPDGNDFVLDPLLGFMFGLEDIIKGYLLGKGEK